MARTERPYEVFCGIDVGKSFHHACALDLDGRRLHDKALTNDETELRAVFTKLQAHGRVLVVIDQPASIGALAIAVARVMDIDIAYLPGLTMRRLADLHRAIDRGWLTLRGFDRCLRLAWTLADLQGTGSPTREDIGIAMGLRGRGPVAA